MRSNLSRYRQVYYGTLLVAVYLGLFFFMSCLLFMYQIFDFGNSYQVEAAVIIAGLQIVHIGLEVFVMVATVFWMARSTHNLQRLGLRTQYGPLQAGLVWLLPFVNLYLPLRIFRHNIRHYRQVLQRFNPEAQAAMPSQDEWSRLTGIWWGLWVFTFPISFGLGFPLMEEISSWHLGWVDDEVFGFIMVTVKLFLDFLLALAYLRTVRWTGRLEATVQLVADSGRIEKHLEMQREAHRKTNSTQDNSSPPTWYQGKLPNAKIPNVT